MFGGRNKALRLLFCVLFSLSAIGLSFDGRSVLAGPVGATLLVQPSSSAPGEAVRVSGKRFPAKSTVNLTWDDTAVATVPAQANGSFSLKFTVPAHSSSGPHTLKGTADATVASATVQVVSDAATPPPTAIPLPTATSLPTAAPSPTATAPRTATPLPTAAPSPTASPTVTPAPATADYRVNAPRFGGEETHGQAGVFWFGKVNSTSNYADVRVGYTDQDLVLRVAAFDRYLWYDGAPSPSTLEDWDAVTLYLSPQGNVGTVPSLGAYRLVAMLNWWEGRTAFQTAYRGNGTGWQSAAIPFTSTTGWRGNAPNDQTDDRGWSATFQVPYTSLGLSGPPPEGTVWGLAVALHDRDDASGTAIPDQTWPPALNAQRPGTWGQMRFGLPSYTPPSVVPSGTVTIRHGLDGAFVPDADLGGALAKQCPGDPDYIWNHWGDTNWGLETGLQIESQGDIADWPCFSKYYVTFPLDAVPAGKSITSAALTLYQFGNADWTAAKPSWIQVLKTDEDWQEDTITWNNAPLPVENMGGAWVEPVTTQPAWPGLARAWDVSRAVAEAYAAGKPARLIMYSADWDYHSGKYFSSSDAADWNAAGRPTLQVQWGDSQSPWPTATPSPTPSATPSPTAISSPTPVASPSSTPIVTSTPAATPTTPTTPTVPPPTGSEWSQDGGNAQRTGYTPEQPLAPWTYLWSFNGPDANGGTGGHLYNAPREARTVMGGGKLYAPAGSHGLYALNVGNGTQAWRFMESTFNAAPAYAAGYVYAGGSNGTLYKLDASDGTIRGTYQAGSPINKAILIVGSFTYAVSDDGRLHKVNGDTMAPVWVYTAGATTATPPSYSATRNVVIYATDDLFVHAVNNDNGSQKWRVKPTPRTPGGSVLTLGGSPVGTQFENAWPVVAENNGVVLLRMQLDFNAVYAYPSTGQIYPTDLATARTWLQDNPQQKSLFALNLDNGAEKFVPVVGYGVVEDRNGTDTGPYGVMGSQPVVKTYPDGSEVAYIHFRNGQGNPPDWRWDSHMGEMVLNDSAIPGLVAGDLRFVKVGNSYVHITDEQTPISVAGDVLFNAHWAASAGVKITDRSASRGLTYADPIQTANLQPFVRALKSDCSNADKSTHYANCSGLSYVTDGGRYFGGPGWLGYYGVADPPGWKANGGSTAGAAYSAGFLPRYTYASGGYLVVEGNGGDLYVFRHSGTVPAPTVTPTATAGPGATSTPIPTPTAKTPSATSTPTASPTGTSMVTPTPTTMEPVSVVGDRFYAGGKPYFPTTNFLSSGAIYKYTHTYFSGATSDAERASMLTTLKNEGYNSIFLYTLNEGDYGGRAVNPYGAGATFDEAKIQSWKSQTQNMIGQGMRPIIWLFADDSPNIKSVATNPTVRAEAKRYISKMVASFNDLPVMWVLALEADEYWDKATADDLGAHLKSQINASVTNGQGLPNPVGIHQLQMNTSYMTSSWVDFGAFQYGFGKTWATIYNDTLSNKPLLSGKPFLAAEYDTDGGASAQQRGLAAAFAGAAGLGNGAPGDSDEFMSALPNSMVPSRNGDILTLTGGGVTATADMATSRFSSTSTVTPVPTSAPTATPETTPTPSATATPTATPTVTPTPTAGPPQRVTLVAIPPATVGVYEKYEAQFAVTTSSQYPFFQYDDSPPAGVAAGIGVSVDGLLTSPSGKVLRQPAFYTTEVVRDGTRFAETNRHYWALRFSPQEVGQYRAAIEVRDASGTTATQIGSFTATAPVQKGFIEVSEDDPRYFEFSNGELFFPIGPAWGDDYARYKDTGQNLERPWMAGEGAYSTNWARWISSAERQGNEGIMTRLTFKEHYPGHELSYELFYPEGFRFWLTTWNNEALAQRFKPNTKYQVRLTYKTVNLTGPRDSAFPFGLVVKAHGFLSHETPLLDVEDTLRNAPKLISHLGNSGDWRTVTVEYTTGSTVSNDISLYLDNVSGGRAYIDEFSVRAKLADGSLGGELIRNPRADQHTYVDSRAAAYFDWQVEQGEQNGVFFKYVVHDKNDWIQNHLLSSGQWADSGSGYYQDENTKARWLLRQWYRYLIGRWGYSTAIHSWELNNEGPPNDDGTGCPPHWQTAQAFAKFMHDNDAHRHLATTSFWCCWRPEFWSNASGQFPDIDYADLHEYTGHPDPTVPGYSYDLAEWNNQTGRIVLSGNIGKPVIRGETGITVNGWTQVPELKQPNPGVWYHNLLWAQLNVGSLYDPGYWFSEHMKYINKEAISKPFSAFVSSLDLNKGGYVDLGATLTNPQLRVYGQKNATKGKVHLWIQNKDHTWKNEYDGLNIVPASGSLTIPGMPAGTYRVSWFDTYSGATTRTETVVVSTNGPLTLTVTGLSTDLAIKAERQAASATLPQGFQLADFSIDNIVTRIFKPLLAAINPMRS